MNVSRLPLLAPVLMILVTAPGCGSSKSNSTSGIKQCAPVDSQCTAAELKTYGTCVQNACDAVNKECLGAAYKSGTYAGPCGAYYTCINACPCNDTACDVACGLPDVSCANCLSQTAVCSTTCATPACFEAPTGSGGAGGGGTGTGGAGTGGRSGQAGGASGSGGSPGSGGATAATGCADLLACCNATTNPNFKSVCMTQYSGVMAMGEAACAAALTSIKSSFCP